MRSIFTLIAALLFTAGFSQAQGIASPRQLTLPDDIDLAALKDAGRAAISQVLSEFAGSNVSAGKSFIILPLAKDIDQGYFTLQFENAFTQKAGASGFKLYTRTDKVLEKVLTEVEFQQSFEDSLNKASMQKLSLVGAESVILPRIDIDRSGDGALTVRASISIHHVSTGEKVWGNEGASFIPGKVTTEQWVTRGIIAFAVFAFLLLLLWITRTIRRAARPR